MGKNSVKDNKNIYHNGRCSLLRSGVLLLSVSRITALYFTEAEEYALCFHPDNHLFGRVPGLLYI